jgi:hypothetical protein
MARKKKPKPFRAVTAVKAAAREHVGMPPPTRREEQNSKKRATEQPKHKAPRSAWPDEEL